MAEEAQSASAASKLLAEPLPTSSSSGSSLSYGSSSASILSLASAYGKLQLGVKIKPPDISSGSSAALEDYNNNNIGSSLHKAAAAVFNNNNSHGHEQSCDNYQNHFISVDNSLKCSEKWNSIRSESPFLANNMMSPPPLTVTSQVVGGGGGGKSMCTSGLTSSCGTNSSTTGVHQSMLCNQMMGGGGSAISNSGGSTANGSVVHKCTGNGGGLINTAPSASAAGQPKKGENCMIHAMPNTLWCLKCHTLICRACAGSDEHRNHNVKTQAKEAIRTEIATELVTMQKSLIEVQHLVLKQRDFLLKILDSCSSLKSQIENELINHAPTLDVSELRDSFCRAKLCLSVLDQTAAASAAATANGGLTAINNGQADSNAASPTSPTSPTPIELYKLYSSLTAEKQRLHQKYQDLYLQCKFDDLLRNSGQVVDYDTISRAMQTLHIGQEGNTGPANSAPLLLMANYCLTQIYTRQSSSKQHQQQSAAATLNALAGNHVFAGHSMDATFPFGDTHTSVSSSQSSSAAAISMPQLTASPFGGGTKSPFLDLAVGSPASTNAGIPALLNSSSHLHHPLHFSQAQATAAATSQIIGNSFGHSFSDNLLLSNVFPPTTSNHHHGLTSSALSTMRHSGSASSGAGGISFEMNGVSVPITMISSQKYPSGIQAGGALSQHHPHHHNHHHHHLLHSTNLSSSSSNSSGSNSIICNPTMHIYPIYYFNIEINGQPCGRILIEVRNDVAPRMAKNFGALASGELGFGYKGCQIFQCWENESIITGDFELNNGRGGRSVFEDGFFMPDDTKILAIRGSVGMRRSQKRHDNMGLVGSQFRIILREMRGFTGIFAFVIEGLELVEKISQTGDSAGKPQSSVLVVSCGKLN